MKKIIFLFVFATTSLPLYSSVSDTTKWASPKSSIQSVYKTSSGCNEIELLRLYRNGTYEHLKYISDQHNDIKRNVGKYRMENKYMILDSPSSREFSANIYHRKLWIKKNIYGNIFASIFKEKDFLFEKTSKKGYRAPFYINPLNGCIVNKKDAAKKIDLAELVSWLTSDCKTEKAKVENIHQFIYKTLKYDYAGLANDHYANSQTDVSAMLAGTKRLAVCAGYSACFEKLVKLCGLEAEYVVGDAKSSNGFEHTSHGCHAWNKVKADGKWYADDVTWDWLLVDPAVMIYSHFPDNEKDQMLDSTMTKDKFNKAVIIFAKGKSKALDFFPKEGLLLGIKEFEFKIACNVSDISVNSLGEGYSNIIYSGEPDAGKSYDYSTLPFQKNIVGEFTVVKIKIPDTVSVIKIKLKGIGEYFYKVSCLNNDDYLKHTARIANNKNIDSYIKGVIACLKMNDLVRLKELVGDTNKLFFDMNGKFILGQELLHKFKTWDGLLSQWESCEEVAFKNGALVDQPAKNKIYFTQRDFFTFEKTSGGYKITQINDKKQAHWVKT